MAFSQNIPPNTNTRRTIKPNFSRSARTAEFGLAANPGFLLGSREDGCRAGTNISGRRRSRHLEHFYFTLSFYSEDCRQIHYWAYDVIPNLFRCCLLGALLHFPPRDFRLAKSASSGLRVEARAPPQADVSPACAPVAKIQSVVCLVRLASAMLNVSPR